ncbi:MAG: hypothetical protein OEW91_02735, partial [Acidimicrobiia bacterium]|nr:hypothetical protein [Acidimicrobiia bacterium]
LLGPDGALENRLTEALDPTADGSGIAAVSNLIERRLAEIRDLVASERGRRDEADRGTAKGFDYEDTMEEILRGHARGLGIIVERTSRDCGALSGEAMVGDFVLTTPEGRRIVVEAKNTRSLSLTGKDGVLALLDRAKANREADIAICVSAQDAFPLEVGQFGVYGDRIAVVDDGDGAMLAVALRWATESLRRDGHESGSDVDAALIDDRLHRMRLLAQRFSTSRRALTEISGSVDKVRDGLDDIRRELLDLVDEASSGLRSGEHAEVLPLTG